MHIYKRVVGVHKNLCALGHATNCWLYLYLCLYSYVWNYMHVQIKLTEVSIDIHIDNECTQADVDTDTYIPPDAGTSTHTWTHSPSHSYMYVQITFYLAQISVQLSNHVFFFSLRKWFDVSEWWKLYIKGNSTRCWYQTSQARASSHKHNTLWAAYWHF